MKKIIIANWKMNPNSKAKMLSLSGALSRGLKGNKAEVVVCAPFVYLPLMNSKFFKLGAQDCFWEKKGAFTGQISVEMLKDLGVRYVLCGHSEKRQFGETDADVHKKVKAVLAAGVSPVLCVGENKEQREKKETFSIIEKQIKEGLKKIPKQQIAKVIIAYEPIWAISPNGPCSPDNAITVILFLRKLIGKITNKQTANNIKILYGGSVNSQDVKDYMVSDFISGVLVGAASLSVLEFIKVVENGNI